MIPKNPLDAVLSEVLGDDGGLLIAGTWSDEQDDASAEPSPPMPVIERPA